MPPPTLDACPGVLALHPARDGYVARIRLPGGYASGPRWRALAGLARSFGDGCLDMTARGNVQLRGIRGDSADALARRAAAAGLLPSAAHDRARNIMASPLAGLAGRAPLRQLVRQLDAVLLSDAGFAALPGRFVFSVDDGTGGSGLAGCDVGLRRAGAGVDVVVAGRRTGVRVRLAAAVPVVAEATRAAIARGVGTSVTRIADLADGGESVAAAIGGSLGTLAASADTRLPLGLAEPGTTPENRLRAETIVVAAPLARLTGGQMLLIADLLRPREIVRVGIAGRLVIPLADLSAAPSLAAPSPAALHLAHPASASPPPTVPLTAVPSAGVALAGVQARLAGAGLVVAQDDALAGVTACSGAACSRSVADVRAAAGPVAAHARTHWVGCARQCGCPPDAAPVIAVDPGHYLLPGQAGPQPLAMLTGAS